ncbi:vacuolar fusion protein MON1-like protein B [Platysternon megacephalum]|uniref:Vacuolar fusion protein MON1-like protein B n=1 Tax=Platysternon megacephalum TaxID=55544 RepID=A0A4D9DNA9_9SAUR|nr:vacuolar fusion protein MON1-like protein B [Platysternon megacephalum]
MSPIMVTWSCWSSNGSSSSAPENCSSDFPSQQGAQQHHSSGTTEQGWKQPTGRVDLFHPYGSERVNLTAHPIEGSATSNTVHLLIGTAQGLALLPQYIAF